MPIPLFVIYELLIRIQELDPAIGSYVSHTFNTTGAVVTTTTRRIKIRNALLNRQFRDPELISPLELLEFVDSK